MILLPSLNRTALLTRFLDSVNKTAPDVPGLVLVDAKDLETHAKEYENVQGHLPKNWELHNTGKNVSMGDKTRWVFLQGFLDDRKYVGILNDDHECLTEGWDKKVEALLDGTNMVSTNDGNWNFGVRVCGLTAWSMGLLKAVDFPIYPRNLQHLYIDDVWKEIGEKSGCWLETNKINIAHRHALKGEMEQDETFKKVYSQGSWEYDAKEFKHFMEQDFKSVVERVNKLRIESRQKANFG